MTKEQKKQIIELRQTGYGYATIASSLGLTKNQVSAFCRRNQLTGTKASVHTEDHPAPNCCRNCGKQLTQTPGRKPVKFCSDTCRTHWWNSHLDKVNRKAFYSFTCAHCGTPSRPTETTTENIALTIATSLTALEVIAMTEEQFEREKLYQATMNVFAGMLKKGLITEKQYAIIDTKMLEKYRPLLGTLFRQIDLI